MQAALAMIIGAALSLTTIPQSPVYAVKYRDNAKKDLSQPPLGIASAYSDDDRQITDINSPAAIVFPHNTIQPVNIYHPAFDDDSLFQFGQKGVYLIEWHMALQAIDQNANVVVQLINTPTNFVISSSQLKIDSSRSQASPQIFCGQTLATLTTQDVVQLQITVTNMSGTELVVSNPTITFALTGE